ncbi:MAG: hypothetical protein AAGA73_01105 [Pseudomonadota bacterium]
MEWLTAILAFATTMLIFSMITTTFVETFHRLIGSRSFGLIRMLEYLYDDVIGKHMGVDQGTSEDADELMKKQRRDFVERMILVRAPAWPVVEGDAASNSSGTTVSSGTPLRRFLGFLRGLWLRWNGASRLAQQLGVNQRRILSHLPLVTFMERLGSSAFASVWKNKYENEPALGEQVLQDIGQKFELYGQEASIFFERKARTIAVLIAMLVAWVFYVHPYDLIQTYLQRPEIAAKVADLSDELLEQAKPAEREELIKLLQTADAPVGWTDGKVTCSRFFVTKDGGCVFPWPDNGADIIWLLIGGLLVGLGAPFWAKAVRQIAEVKDAPKNVAKILKPEEQPQTAEGQQPTPSAGTRSEAIEAFYVAVAAGQAQAVEPASPSGPSDEEIGE